MLNEQTSPEQSVETLLSEAELYESQGLYREARSRYEEVLQQIEPGLPLRAELEDRLKNIIERFEQGGPTGIATPEAGEKDDDFLKRFENSEGLMQAGFHAEAIEELKGLLPTLYKPGEVNARLGDAYLSLRQPYDAIEHLQEALGDDSIKKERRLEVLYKLALTLEQTGDVPRAVDALYQIVQINPAYQNAAERLENLSKTVQRFGRFHYLIRKELLSDDQLKRAGELAKEQKISIESLLLGHFGIDKVALGQSLHEYYGCPFIEFNELEVGSKPPCMEGIKEHFFRTNTCVPIREDGDTLLIALDNPNDLVKIDNLRTVLKVSKFTYAVALKEDIDKFIDYFYGKYGLAEQEEDVFEQIELVEEEDEIALDEEEDIVSEADSVVVQMVNKTIEDALKSRATDIHIESLSGKRGSHIRLRIDGDLIPYQNIPFNYKKAIVSRIKIMSNLDIAEKRLPQDGKIKFKTRTGRNLELRVATLPTSEGNEDIVMRILASSDAMPVDRIGLLDHNLEKLLEILEYPYGLILVVGPTGSGKTTTLHAALGRINRPDRKIWTVEDPIEIVQEGLRQVQVRPDIELTFARVLRSFLRADPDIIMIGETRDEETATAVIEASLTGHLVLSTLHTNSAPETVTRLLGMGMDPFNFADALLGVLAQRLVKRLCSKCKEEYAPDEEERQGLIREYGDHPTKPLTSSEVEKVKLFRPKGCQHCNQTGYRGRIAIHEFMISDDGLKKMIQNKETVENIRHYAMSQGMLTLKQDGILKAMNGETDLRQVRLACIR